MNELNKAQLYYLNLLTERGCKILFKTILFDKQYVWMKDPAGTVFLEKLPVTNEEETANA